MGDSPSIIRRKIENMPRKEEDGGESTVSRSKQFDLDFYKVSEKQGYSTVSKSQNEEVERLLKNRLRREKAARGLKFEGVNEDGEEVFSEVGRSCTTRRFRLFWSGSARRRLKRRRQRAQRRRCKVLLWSGCGAIMCPTFFRHPR